MFYDRLGTNEEFTTILDMKIPAITIPIKPGRNLAIIVEVAAMNNRHKRMGLQRGPGICQAAGRPF